MFEVLEQYLKKTRPDLTRDQVSLIHSKSIVKKLRKRYMLLHEGEVSTHKIFVVKGLLRNYSVGDNGNEYVIKFTDAGGWTTEPDSYNNQAPSKFNIDALEPSEVLMWSRDDFERLKQIIPPLTSFSEAVMARNISLTQRRVLMNISGSAEEKYIDFIETFPDIFNRVPLHMVASYLGVSRETLTRIRQGLAMATKE